jgi:hypothetical protein
VCWCVLAWFGAVLIALISQLGTTTLTMSGTAADTFNQAVGHFVAADLGLLRTPVTVPHQHAGKLLRTSMFSAHHTAVGEKSIPLPCMRDTSIIKLASFSQLLHGEPACPYASGSGSRSLNRTQSTIDLTQMHQVQLLCASCFNLHPVS